MAGTSEPDLKELVILADHGHAELAQETYNLLSRKIDSSRLHRFDPDDLYLNRFNDGEIEVQIKTNVRKKDVFVIKSFNVVNKRWTKKEAVSLVYNANEGYQELFLINDALKRASASEIADILFYMPYLRQDRKKEPRTPISAKYMAKATEESGATRLLTLEPHFKQIQGFYEINFDDLKASILFAEYLEQNFDLKDFVIASPDLNGAPRAEELAKLLGLPLVVVYKRRVKPGCTESKGILKFDDIDLKNKNVIFYDDMIDTGNTIIKGAEFMRMENVNEIYACFAHAVLSKDAKERLTNEAISLVTTNSIPVKEDKNMKVISLAYFCAEAIHSIYTGSSISRHLFDYKEYKNIRARNGF